MMNKISQKSPKSVIMSYLSQHNIKTKLMVVFYTKSHIIKIMSSHCQFFSCGIRESREFIFTSLVVFYA